MQKNQILSPGAKEASSIHRRERNALLEAITLALECDPRVRAAFLFGSLGRGEEDDLSDLDLIVVLDAPTVDALRASSASQVRYIAQAGPLLGHVSAPHNALLGGAYRMALYAGTNGPLHVDWYFAHEANSLIAAPELPSDTRLLIDRIGLARKPRHDKRLWFEPHGDAYSDYEDLHLAEADRAIEQARNRAAFFWAMTSISAKYVVRQREDEELFVGGMLLSLLRETAEFAGATSIAAGEGALPTTSADKINYLRPLSAQMEGIHPELAARGVLDVPFALAASVRRYLDLVASLTAER